MNSAPRTLARQELTVNTTSVGDQLIERARVLREVLTDHSEKFDPADVAYASQVVDRTDERLLLGPEHTVVALAGSTGSGKSSLMNSLAGLDVAKVGARRPTTSEPLSCQWGGGGEELLNWLAVPQQFRRTRETALDGDRFRDLHGLILLDMPDHDSHVVAHRVQVDRLVEQVDVLLWVVDPQKYADDLLHNGYLKPLTSHQDIMYVVLNQVDRLPADEVSSVLGDLRRLLDDQGLDRVKLLATSASSGVGLDELHEVLRAAVADRHHVAARALADLETARLRLSAGVGDKDTTLASITSTGQLVDTMAVAAGVPAVVGAVRDHYVRSAQGYVGWPYLRWTRALRPDPLRRLGLEPGNELAPELTRTSLPQPSHAARSAVDRALRSTVQAAGHGLPQQWQAAVRDAGVPHEADLHDVLDQAIISVRMERGTPAWWQLFRVLHLLSAAAFTVGTLWLALLGVMGWLRLPALHTPTVAADLPWPTVLCLGGLIAGIILSVVGVALARVGARKRGERTEAQLVGAIERVVESTVLEPVGRILDQHTAVRRALSLQ